MGTLAEDLEAIKTVDDTLVNNKVARFAYTEEAYTANHADGVEEYDVGRDHNIPKGLPSIMKVNSTVLDLGYRAQASSITRMLMNHFLGRLSYNTNKTTDMFHNLLGTLQSHLGTPNGFASLDENGRIPFSQLPESALELKGTWDASTNTPSLVDGTGTLGDFYMVTVAGSQTFSGQLVTFNVNDRIMYNGTTWQKLSAGDVKKVNGNSPDAQGDVTVDVGVKKVNGSAPDTNGNIALLDFIYPVGSVYWTSKAPNAGGNPNTLFGGTWVQIKDTFIWAKGDQDTVNSTGGAKTHTITTSEMPSHTHTFTTGATSKTTTGNKSVPHYHQADMLALSIVQMAQDLVYAGIGRVVKGTGDSVGFAKGALEQDVGYEPYVAQTTEGAKTADGTTDLNHAHDMQHTHSGTTNGSGSGTAMSIMPPYVVKYCWERTA